MIDVELGLAQVEERRAADESYGLNGLDTNSDPSVPEARESEAPCEPQVRVIPEGESEGRVEAGIKAEKLKQAEFLTNRLKLEDGARHGKYMDAQEAQGEMTRVADEMLKIFEGALPDSPARSRPSFRPRSARRCTYCATSSAGSALSCRRFAPPRRQRRPKRSRWSDARGN
jgi:hypothetical protein